MALARGQVWRADFGQPRGSTPAYVRPAVVVSADEFNRAALQTVTVVAVTSTVRLASLPGNVLIPAGEAGLDAASVANITQIDTLDRDDLVVHLGDLPAWLLAKIDDGIRKTLALT
jgi:mRNA interferase MazF